ncbi:MAG TPA: hypothetical protein VFY97_02405 [Rhodanobacteraceae bacterium]|nr:hypothetical protein [Rhodanobacteraceae bacterium]
MGERRFKIELGAMCIREEAVGVMVKGDDGLWRYWLEFDGRCIPGVGEFPPTRAGHARLKARAADQFESLVYGHRRSGTPEDVQ